MSHARGAQAEALAANYLSDHGMRILVRNFRCRMGEIDLIGLDGETLCFIEVKQRTRARYGSAVETVDRQKRHRIIHTAQFFLATAWKGPRCACRFDVVTVEGKGSASITQLKGAFEI